eukprot:3396083-Rhodomonas_salina.1
MGPAEDETTKTPSSTYLLGREPRSPRPACETHVALLPPAVLQPLAQRRPMDSRVHDPGCFGTWIRGILARTPQLRARTIRCTPPEQHALERT